MSIYIRQRPVTTRLQPKEAAAGMRTHIRLCLLTHLYPPAGRIYCWLELGPRALPKPTTAHEDVGKFSSETKPTPIFAPSPEATHADASLGSTHPQLAT